jgi:hypothetical protein
MREIVEPMSPAVSVYVAADAPRTAAHCAPVALQRRHWYTKELGAPDQVPTEVVSVWPACAVPVTVGVEVATGRVAVLPPAVTATVGG